MDLVFSHGDLAEGSRTLKDSSASTAEPDSGLEQPAVVEMRLESYGAPVGDTGGDSGVSAGSSAFPPAERPLLLAILSDGSLLLYRAGHKQVRYDSAMLP